MATTEVKVSFHSETASNTAAHNDRSMYKDKEKRGDESQNVHWDCYDLGSSVDAERRFYEEHFSDLLLAQNERYMKQRHPERVLDIDGYMKAHPVHESVMAIGNKDNQVPPGYLERIEPIIKEQMASHGCYLISLDIHYDKFVDEDGVVHEATPGMHIRWMGIDSKGKPNLNGALAEHGIVREKPNERRSQYNNELKVFTAQIRERLEAEADAYLEELNAGITLSRERDPEAQHHDDIPTYRRRARAKEREAEADNYIEAVGAAAQEDMEQTLEHSRLMAELYAEDAQVMAEGIIDERLAVLDHAYEVVQQRAAEDYNATVDEAKKVLVEANEVSEEERKLREDVKEASKPQAHETMVGMVLRKAGDVIGDFLDHHAQPYEADSFRRIWGKHVVPNVRQIARSIAAAIWPTAEQKQVQQQQQRRDEALREAADSLAALKRKAQTQKQRKGNSQQRSMISQQVVHRHVGHGGHQMGS